MSSTNVTCRRCGEMSPTASRPKGWVEMHLGSGAQKWAATICDKCDNSLYRWLLGAAA